MNNMPRNTAPADTGKQLVFIYGSPGVGKLTVAKELVVRTGYDLFHNHITYDEAVDKLKLVPFSPEFNRFVAEKRIALFEDFVKKSSKKGLITTHVYNHTNQKMYEEKEGQEMEKQPHLEQMKEDYIGQLKKFVTEYSDSLESIFVQLIATKETIYERIESESRLGTNKLHNAEQYREYAQKYDYVSPISGIHSHRIDTTGNTIDQTASKIYELLKQ